MYKAKPIVQITPLETAHRNERRFSLAWTSGKKYRLMLNLYHQIHLQGYIGLEEN